MKIALLDVKSASKQCINKDFMAGYGWAFNAGGSLLAKIINIVKEKGELLPLLSFGYLAGIFKKYGHEVEYVTNKIPHADIVFISSSMVDYRNEIGWAKKISAAGSKVGFIGIFASSKPELFLPYCDFLIRGEPEEACIRFAQGETLEGFVEGSSIKDLDILPFPDWDIFPYNDFSYRPALKDKPFFPILFSRGCAFKCDYCPYPVFYSYRTRSVENTIEEIGHLITKYGMKSMLFRDPLFSCNKKKAVEIAEAILKKGWDIRWACETGIDVLDEELIKLFYESGCRVINVGVESSNNGLLKKVHRRMIEKDYQKRIVDYADSLGIRITAFYVLGLPGENVQSVKKTIQYAKWLNTYVAQFFVYTPFPGTTGYEEYKNLIIEKDWEKFDCYTPVIKYDELTTSQLSSLKEKAFISYYYRPRYLCSFIRRVGRAMIYG
tara:strand:+ start:195 stop:1505 length:1311 start_codon:yes stop_codon:yes gene_type:complete